MILKANGLTVDFFEKFFTERYNKNKKRFSRIAVSFSGGVDSSLTLYCLCKSIMLYNLQEEITVYAFNANITDYEYLETSKTPTENCYRIITELFPKIKFGGLHFYDISHKKIDGDKIQKLKKARKTFLQDINCSFFLTGTTNNPPIGANKKLDEVVKNDYRLRIRYRDMNKEYLNEPFAKVDKSFLAEIYKQENLLDNLYPATVSCTYMSFINPCKKCYWCEEKYWSFGSYDGGDKEQRPAIHILTLKVGTKYSAEYVNKLYLNIKKNTTVNFKFYCYTEDSKGILPEIKIIPLNNPDEFQLQWHKLKLHKNDFASIAPGEKCLLLDIDWIVIDNIDEILTYDLPQNHIGVFERWWSNLRHFCKLNGGFQMFYMCDTHYIWNDFNKNPEYWQRHYIDNGFAVGPVNGEQNFIHQHGKNKHWLPMEWFAKYHSEDWIKINRNWEKDVNPNEPYYMGGDFAESIKMVHFSNSENLIHKTKEQWVKQYW